jgi:hypothetical protein
MPGRDNLRNRAKPGIRSGQERMPGMFPAGVALWPMCLRLLSPGQPGYRSANILEILHLELVGAF